MQTLLDSLITTLNALPPEGVSLLELAACLTALAGFLRYYGAAGLYSFIAILLVVANIQVLKGAQFSFIAHPIALGTLLFGIIAVTFDIITEYYGKPAALRGVRLSFLILTFFTILMIGTVGIKPLEPSTLTPDELFLASNHEHIKALFVPLPGILLASLIAYLTSQYVDVMIYYFIKRITLQRLLWFRAFLSTALSALVDTMLFSFLAWKLFSPQPVSWQTLFTVYIFGTYPLRLACSFCFSPLVYFARYLLPNKP